MFERIEKLTAGTPILIGGDRVVRVSEELAARFRPGDALLAVEATGELLHVPAPQRRVAAEAVDRAVRAFSRMASVSDAQISRFFEGFAARLESDGIWREIARENQADVEDARARGRSTTRLEATDKLRRGMIEGLRGWTAAPSLRGRVLECVEHEGWRAELVAAELGVVGFVFEGRPNVLADATGVLRGGNTVVFRIGRDALRTARAILARALEPALAEAGLPDGAAVLVDSAEHAAGWALFSDARLALAVARGSGPAVDTLGAIAQRAGVPVSLHGTGGAWIVAGESARADELADVVAASLDRKVCNTANVCCLPRSRARDLVPAVLDGLERAGARLGQSFKLHVVRGSTSYVPAELFDRCIPVARADGERMEPQAEPLDESDLGREWEWERTPEVSLVIVDAVDGAVDLFHRYSPRFVVSLVSEDDAEHRRFYERIDAPFVGDGFTRWVDGQYALRRPELGLSNWQRGRLFGRGAILTGDGVYTVRTRARRSGRP